MAETRKIVQLHKKDDIEEQWIPLTTGKCVQLTDYENNGETGLIEQTDTLNNALAKLENDKAERGETLAEYNIGDAYTKEEVDAKLVGIYYVKGGINSTDIHSTLSSQDTKVGDVYDLRDDTVMTADFHEYEGVPTPVVKGTNIVVVNDGTDENPVYKFDILALSVAQSIVVATANSLGGIEVGYTTDSANKNYAVQLDGNDAYVNVPWADTQYSLTLSGNTLSLTPTGGLSQSVTLPTELPASENKSGKYLKVINNNGDLSWETDNNTEYTSGVGLDLSSGVFKVKLNNETQSGTIGTGTVYAVGVDTSGELCVNVPWADTHYTATPVLSGSSSGTSNATQSTANNSTYLNITENSQFSGGVQIEGSGMVTVSAKNGKLTVSATDPIPDQTNNNNKFLTTNGTTLSWATPSDLNTFRAIQVDNTQLLANDSNKALDIIGGKNITLTTDNSHSDYATMTIDVTVGDVTNPTITSNVLAVEYGKNYFVGSSTATAAGVAADQNPVSTLGFTVSGNSGFEANVFFKAGASGSGMTVNIPSGFLLIGEQPEYVSGNVYLISFYKGTAIMGEMTTYEYIRLTVRPNQPYTDRQVLIASFNAGGASFGDEELSANDFIEDPNSEHTFYYKYPSNKHLTSIECLTYSGSISAVEITEDLSELENGFRGFQQTDIVSLPNATFNSSFYDGGQLFNLGDIVEIYVPTQPICELTYLNLYDADTLSVRSIENISYWLGNSGGDINFSETAWNRLSSEQKTIIRNRIEGKNWTIRFEDYTPNN